MEAAARLDDVRGGLPLGGRHVRQGRAGEGEGGDPGRPGGAARREKGDPGRGEWVSGIDRELGCMLRT